MITFLYVLSYILSTQKGDTDNEDDQGGCAMRCIYESCYYNVNERCGINYFEMKDGKLAERPNFCPIRQNGAQSLMD